MTNPDEDLIEIPSEEIAALESGAAELTKPAREPAIKAEPLERDTFDAEREALRRERDSERAERERFAREAALERDGRIKAEGEVARRTDQTLQQYHGRAIAERRQAKAEFDHVDGMLVSHASEIAATQDALRRAKETGQIDQEVTLQTKLGELSAAKLALEQAKRSTESALREKDAKYREAEELIRAAPVKKDEPKAEEKNPDPPKQLTPDEWIAQQPRKTAAWLRENKDYVTDPAKHKELIMFANGYAQDYGANSLHSPQFLSELENKFGSAGDDDTVAQNEERPTRKAAPEVASKPATRSVSSAPVSRGNNLFSSRNLNATAGKLPPHIAKFVKEAGLDPTKYFHETVELIKKGEMPKDFLDN